MVISGLMASPSWGRIAVVVSRRMLKSSLVSVEHIAFAQGEELGVPASIVSAQDHGSLLVVDVAVGSDRLKMKVRRDVSFPAGQARLRVSSDQVRLYVDGVLVN